MSVGKIYRKTLWVVNDSVKAVEIDIVIAAALHLGELKVLFFLAHIVDVNYLCR